MISYYMRWLLAYFRISKKAVCEMSKGLGMHNDFHDYPDDVVGTPSHFVIMTCRRCGKLFIC